MSTTKEDRRAPPNLEKVIDSDRYKIVGFLGRGCWGSVYEARDLLGRTVAIKVIDPTDSAKRQMQERNLDELAAMKNEALELQACANIVPRTFEVDKNGVPFIVMPKYEKFFSDVLANPPNKNTTRWGALGEEKPLKTGFYMSDIIKISEDIINGLAEIHDTYDRSHCDIKPDNLAVDKNGKVLISDMGTSTYASFGMSESPRDNMGYAYTRSPRLFIEGAHPKKSSDVFAFGSLLYRMFTGEYVFEKEINEAARNGGEEAVKSLMKELKNNPYKLSEIVSKKLENSEIPIEFRKLIGDCIEEHPHDGKDLKNYFENAVKAHLESKIERSKFDEFKQKAKTGFRNGLITGTVLAGLGLGLGWLLYFAPRPDYASKTDLETQASVRKLDKSDVILEIERKYENVYTEPNKEPRCQEGRFFFGQKESEKTLIDHIITQWYKTANEVPGNEFRNDKAGDSAFPHDLNQRWVQLRHGNPHDVGLLTYDKLLQELLPIYFALNQLNENVIDLEDTLTATLLGTQKLREAQKSANNCDFASYVSAKNAKGEYIIPENQQRFLKQLLYNISQTLPQKVRLK